MRNFRRQRTRILVATAYTDISSQLTTLLSGHKVLVDSVEDLAESMDKFRKYRHPIIFIDEELIPSSVTRLLSFFQFLQRDCLVVVLTRSSKNFHQLGLFAGGVFDVMTLPLVREELSFRVKRMIRYHRLQGHNRFLAMLLMVGLLLLPPIFLLLWKVL